MPSLQGFLKKEGVTNVSIRDLNIEIMDALLSSEQVKKTYANIIERLSDVTESFGRENNEAELISRLEWTRDVIEGENMVQNVEWAKANLRSEGFYNLDGYVESWKII
ncbi:MAG TPA: B12-binding domain-containing radical SAM protein, partial [Candidatus Scalindua sp.]|nr:B12-binding domain-containing radical SAM protein [Candidatus Scalindua sp.]